MEPDIDMVVGDDMVVVGAGIVIWAEAPEATATAAAKAAFIVEYIN